jgi:hypothetical protein
MTPAGSSRLAVLASVGPRRMRQEGKAADASTVAQPFDWD